MSKKSVYASVLSTHPSLLELRRTIPMSAI